MCEQVTTSVAALGGNPLEAIEDLDALLAAEPKGASLSPDQRELRQVLGVL